MTQLEALEYEILASSWTGYVSNNWLQKKIADYYLWKVRRKYARYMRRMEFAQKHNLV